MLVTPFPIVTLVSPVQPEKEEDISPLVITTSSTALLLHCFEIYETIAAGPVILVRIQPEKASLPMLVTLSGMTMLVKPVQPSKAEESMLVTLPSVGMTLVLQPKISVFVAVSIRQFPAL